jgi:Nucleotidyl transferase
MPTSPGPQGLQAPSVLLLWIAPALFLAYRYWLSRTWGRLALLGALLPLFWRLCVHIPSPFAVTMDHYLKAILGINKSPTPNGLPSASPAREGDKRWGLHRKGRGRLPDRSSSQPCQHNAPHGILSGGDLASLSFPVPKEMLPIAGKPLIQYAVEEAAASGIETVIIVVREQKSLIQADFSTDHTLESFLDQRGLIGFANLVRDLPKIAELQFVRQRKSLGLAHAVACARSLLDKEPFLVLLPVVIMVSREPVVRQLIRCCCRSGSRTAGWGTFRYRPSPRHGDG